MDKWDKYPKFDVVDWLTDEEICDGYVKAFCEDGESEEDIAMARADVERARAVHGFGPEPKRDVETIAGRAVSRSTEPLPVSL